MKAGKTIIQIYAVWGMFVSALSILGGLGLGILSGYMPTDVLNASSVYAGFGIALVVIGALEFYVNYYLLKFKDWARLVTSALIGLGLVMSLFSMSVTVFLLIDVFILYLMWMDKDTVKLFKK